MKNFEKRVILIVVAYILLLGIITFVLIRLHHDEPKDLYYNLAVALIISWIILLLIYYIWAIQFYNVNFGWAEQAWKRHEINKKDKPEIAKKEPPKNPNDTETLGLPPGTIRGTIALSLLVAGLAVMIASLSMESRLTENEFFVDNFEFFKTAFLMMIAFYFGNKSLDFLRDRQKVIGGAGSVSQVPHKSGIRSGAVASASEARKVLAGDDLKGDVDPFDDPDSVG